MDSPKVVLYDVASKHGVCNSPNTWKTRLLLNYKKIPYETEFLEYPDIAARLRALNIEPFPDGASYTAYTLPAVTIKDASSGTAMHNMDSLPIARALEDLIPEPTLFVEDPASADAESKMMQLLFASFAAYMPKIPNILNTRSAEYYHRERSALFGTSLADIEKAKGATAYDDSQAQLQAFKDKFVQDPSGPFIRGKQVSYADFVFVAWLLALQQFDDAVFKKFIGFDKSFQKVFDACAEWAERRSY